MRMNGQKQSPKMATTHEMFCVSSYPCHGSIQMAPAPLHCSILGESPMDESDGVNVVLMPILWMQGRLEKGIAE